MGKPGVGRTVGAATVVLALIAAGAVSPVQGAGEPVLGAGTMATSYDLPDGIGAGFAADANPVPRFPDENTLGWTTLDDDFDLWKKDTDSTPITFVLDMGPMANKDQLQDDEGGYWLLLGFDMVGFFVIDNDGKFDSYLDPSHDGIGDEPCHAQDFRLFDLFVNGNPIHTAMGTNDQPCNVESARTFEIVPMTKGEAANQFRVRSDWVQEGKNTIRIQLHDTGFGHPSANKFNDGWQMFVRAAAMELVAPPLFISHGWNSAQPPGGHDVAVGDWQRRLAQTFFGKTAEHFGQNPWAWADPGGVWLFAFDGKQDFRISGRQLKQAVLDTGSQVGYCYSCGDEGFWFIGFSMGGLVGRSMIQREGMLPLLGKYVSIGTPHEGSTLSDIYVELMDKKGPPYRTIDGDNLRRGPWPSPFWKDWWKDSVQARVYENNDFEWLALPPHWEGDGALLDHRADFELKRYGNPIVAGLNADAGILKGKAFAVAGDGANKVRDAAALVRQLWWLRLLPDSDLIVSVDSARLGGLYDGIVCDAVHVEVPLVGGVIPFYMDVDACIHPVFEFLTGYRGPGAVSGSPLDAVVPPPLGPPVALAEVQQDSLDLVPDLVTGEAVEERTVRVEPSPRAVFQAYWGDAGDYVEVTVVSPAGQEYTRANAEALGAAFDQSDVEGLHRILFLVPDPAAGDWTVRVEATEDTPAWGLGVVLVSAVESPLALVADGPNRVDPGESALLTAHLTDPAADVTIEATTFPTELDLALHDDGLDGDAVAGDGVFSARYDDTDEAGFHVFDLTATGTVNGESFARSTRFVLTSTPRLDLRVRDLAVEPALAWWGDTVRARATVENIGTGVADSVRVAWGDDSDTRRVVALDAAEELLALAPGESRVVEIEWTPSPGLRTLRVEAFADGLEEALDDNRASTSFEVIPTPRTAATLEGPRGDRHWFLGPVTVTLAPFDATPAPYLSTSFRLDAGADQTYEAPFSVDADGEHALAFQSVDPQGRVEPLRSASFGIDALPPAVALVRPTGATVNVLDQSVGAPTTMPVVVGLVEVEIQAHDDTSGLARLEFRVDGELVRAFEEPADQTVWAWDSTTTSAGRHRIEANARDRAGHVSAVAQDVYVTVSRALQIENDPRETLDRLLPPVNPPLG